MSRWLPVAASSHAADVDTVIVLVHVLMLALLVGWGTYFVWVLIRYRQSRQPAPLAAGTRGRLALSTEVLVVLCETALLVGLAVPLWFRLTATPASADGATVVRVVAEQFAWTAHYPGADGQFGQTRPALLSDTNPLGLDRTGAGRDDIVSPGLLHVPVNIPVIVQLSSKDVIHSFGVPAMRIKQDAVPGLSTPVRFTPTREGPFEIVCSQLCGLAHYRMRGLIVVDSVDAYRRFLAEEAALLR